MRYRYKVEGLIGLRHGLSLASLSIWQSDSQIREEKAH